MALNDSFLLAHFFLAVDHYSFHRRWGWGEEGGSVRESTVNLPGYFSSANFCIVYAIDPTPVGTRPENPSTYGNVIYRLVSFKI